MLIAPSILNADNLRLAEGISQAVKAGIRRFHIDIMDGHFVSNLSYGPQLVSDFKKEFPKIEAEVHLMSNNLDVMIPAFVEAGCDLLEFHYEAATPDQVGKWLTYLKEHNVKAGLALNPDTYLEVLNDYADRLDQVLLMTVFPGFGGQKFIPESPARIAAARDLLSVACPKHVPLEVDGGINGDTAGLAKNAGAEIFVAGSYIFGNGSIAGQVNRLNELLEE